jgi:hypothetical protein
MSALAHSLQYCLILASPFLHNTDVHRYLVEETIEIKIDKLRVEHQEDQLEDSINEVRNKSAINGGGIDGGFRSQEELLDMLRI